MESLLHAENYKRVDLHAISLLMFEYLAAFVGKDGAKFRNPAYKAELALAFAVAGRVLVCHDD